MHAKTTPNSPRLTSHFPHRSSPSRPDSTTTTLPASHLSPKKSKSSPPPSHVSTILHALGTAPSPRLTPPVPTAFAAAAQLAFGYAGHITFFAIISDFRDPHHYPRSLFTLQALATSIYITIPTLLYIFVGPAVPSPALGAAGPTASKIAYGIALVTILGSGAIIGHICAKLMFQLVCRTLRGRRARRADEDAVLSPERGRGVWVWVGCILLTWSVSWVVSESVPDLSALLSLISALFVSWFTFGLSNVMWFHMNWSGRAGFWREGGWKTRGLVGVNVGILGIAAVLFGVGIYASGIGVGKASGSGSWSCGKSG
jgi:hypothetical protein